MLQTMVLAIQSLCQRILMYIVSGLKKRNNIQQMYCPMHFTNLIPCKDLYIAMLSEKGEGGIQARLSARAVFIADNYKSTLSSGNLRIYGENT